ncbi:MAG: DUF1127 domain-containing protein [Roseomonas sp.]|nr:DUF1127 domain-containing protein [Roseomonas sp.]
MSDFALGRHSAATTRVQFGWAMAPLSWAFRLVLLMLARHHERRLLASLDARTLRDLGLSREEAGQEAQKWFWQA